MVQTSVWNIPDEYGSVKRRFPQVHSWDRIDFFEVQAILSDGFKNFVGADEFEVEDSQPGEAGQVVDPEVVWDAVVHVSLQEAGYIGVRHDGQLYSRISVEGVKPPLRA